MAGVKLSGVEKAFADARILKGIDLDIADGEFIVFVGPSGCGKSTLLRVIAGLEEVTRGSLQIDGVEVADAPPAERGIAMVFQSYALYPHMTNYENMAFALRLSRVDSAEIDRLVRDAAGKLNIAHLLQRYPKDLSGGQRQRVAIGRAIVRQPKVFLFDEPLSNLDAELRVRMRYEFARLHETLGTTMIYVTHDQVEAMTLADRIVVLREGRVEQVGAPLDLYEAPVNEFVAGFIGSPRMNFLPATVLESAPQQVRAQLTTGETLLAAVDGSGLQAGDHCTVGVRPEHMAVCADAATADDDAARHNHIAAKVSFIEALGSSTVLYCTGAGVSDAITVQLNSMANAQAARRDASVRLQFAAAQTHVFRASGEACRRHGVPSC